MYTFVGTVSLHAVITTWLHFLFLQKPAEEHQHKAAKSEPLDNWVLRAFERVMGARCRVKDGKAALDQLRSSIRVRSVSGTRRYTIVSCNKP